MLVLTRSRKQYHLNGVRISEFKYHAIIGDAMARHEIRNSTINRRECLIVEGMTESMYRRYNKPTEQNWAEMALSSGHIENLADYEHHR